MNRHPIVRVSWLGGLVVRPALRQVALECLRAVDCEDEDRLLRGMRKLAESCRDDGTRDLAEGVMRALRDRVPRGNEAQFGYDPDPEERGHART